MSIRRLLVAMALGAALITSAVPAAAKPVIAGTEKITQLTKKSGVGPHPILRWKKAKDAVRYLVVVQTPKGDPYWVWQGDATRVRLGGGPEDAPKKSDGASLTRKLVWFVVGLDEAGLSVASSDKRPIAR